MPYGIPRGPTRVIRPFSSKKDLTNAGKISIIRVSGWQAYQALPLGNVLASHLVEDKRLIPDGFHDKNTEDHITPG